MGRMENLEKSHKTLKAYMNSSKRTKMGMIMEDLNLIKNNMENFVVMKRD